MSLAEKYRLSKIQPGPSLNFFSNAKPRKNNLTPDLITLSQYRAAQDLSKFELKPESPQKYTTDEDEVSLLKQKITSLEEQLSSYKSNFCKNCQLINLENQKLKGKLNDSNSSIERLYKENKLLNDQISLLHSKLEDLIITEDKAISYNSLKNYFSELVQDQEQENQKIFKALKDKIKLIEVRLESMLCRSMAIPESLRLDDFSLAEILNPPVPSKAKPSEFEKEIFQLGLKLMKQQEKFDDVLRLDQEKINELNSEIFKLKEEAKLSVKSNGKEVKNAGSKISAYLSRKSLSPAKADSDGLKVQIEELTSQIKYLNTTYSSELEILNKELELLKKAYSKQGAVLQGQGKNGGYLKKNYLEGDKNFNLFRRESIKQRINK